MEVNTEELQKLTELIVDCPHSTPKWTDTGYAVLRNQFIKKGALDLSNLSFTDKTDFGYRIKRAKPQYGDLVLTREAPMGDVCQIPKELECCLGQRMVLIRCNVNKLLPDYALYAIQSRYVQHQIGWSKGTGTTVSNLRIPIIKSLQIPTPSLNRQREVAHILKTLDDKIALNRRTNATLEAMAQVLFKSWFVDFDPVIDNALESGRPLPEALRARGERRRAVIESGKYPRLPAETRALFPDGFVWSEELDRWVPEGWEFGSLNRVATLNTTSIKPQDFLEEVFVHYSIPAYDASKMPVHELGGSIKSGKYQVAPGAILMSKLNPITKRLWLVPETNANFQICSTEFMQLVPVRENQRCYVYLLLDSQPIQNAVLGTVTGSTGSRQRAQPKAVVDIPVMLPHSDLINAFCKQADPLLDRQNQLRLLSDVLISNRDLLLPRLIGNKPEVVS